MLRFTWPLPPLVRLVSKRLTDAEVAHLAKPGESWVQARERLGRCTAPVMGISGRKPCNYYSSCRTWIRADLQDGFCAKCARSIDDENMTRWEQEEWDREDRITHLKAEGLFEQAVAEAKREAELDPIPFDPVEQQK